MTVPLPLIKPSDAVAWTQCARRVWLDNKGEFEDVELDPFDQLVIDLGLAHEHRVLEKLSGAYDVYTASTVEDTARLMAEGVDVIYQGQLFDEAENISGFPDFLIRDESGGYRAADAKLSLDAGKEEIQVQLGLYRKMLGNSLSATVYLGDGSIADIGDEADALVARFVSEMRSLLSEEDEPLVRYGHSKCSACPYYGYCKPGFLAREDISLLYDVDGRSVGALEAAGITTIRELSLSDPATIPDVPYLKGNKKSRAVLQAKSWFDSKVYQTGEIVLPERQWVHFDIEDNPLTASGEKHVYLWGFLLPDYGNNSFEYVWTDREEQDRGGWIGFLEKIEEFRRRYGSLVLAHYSNHERTTIRKYAERYGMEDHETVRYLVADDGPLFDLRKPVVDNLVLPLQAYGLKDICKHPDLVNFQWQDDESGSQWSVVQFNRFLEETNEGEKSRLKKAILGYNRDDVIATRRLEEWLRREFVGRFSPSS